jgi:hypothetical protein
MLLLRTSKLPEGDNWIYEIKWDGYGWESPIMPGWWWALSLKDVGVQDFRMSRRDSEFLEC